tara:strand:+ start:19918 stop:21072 length:1155 start_codon:yes stop_codon:yes gene_type:complete
MKKFKDKKVILVVFGTRPEAIKMAPVILSLKKTNKFNIKVCVTAQHRQMLDQVNKIFDISPDIDLNIMKENQNLFDVTTTVMNSMKIVLDDLKPDLILVHGDTTTSFAAALAAFYQNIPLGHIEAGLRTNNLRSPFPEEFNRRVTGLVSNIHFAPTLQSKKNLMNEGVGPSNILITGNTVIDALMHTNKKLDEGKLLHKKVLRGLQKYISFNPKSKNYILITGHRRENFGKKFESFCNAIKELSEKYPNLQFIYPVHLNPNVLKPTNKILKNCNNVTLIEPVNYLEFIFLMKYSHLIITDSGGIQEEAPSLNIPVLVTREVTERPEGVKSGAIKLVGTNKKNIISNVSLLLNDKKQYEKMANAKNPYGDGSASDTITKYLIKKL